MGEEACTLELLARSKKVPLEVSVYASLRNPVKSLGLLFGELPRIRSLKVRAESSDTVATLLPLSGHVPLLRSLHIHCSMLTGLTPSEAPFFLDELESPNLTHLELTDTGIPWSSSIFKLPLTHLILKHSTTVVLYQGADISHVMDVLGAMSSLQTLELVRMLPDVAHDQLASGHCISLPALRKLTLTDTSKSCVVMLKNTNFPPTTSLHIQSLPKPDEDMLQLYSILATKLRGSDSTEPIRPILSATFFDGIFKAYDVSEPPGRLGQDSYGTPSNSFLSVARSHGDLPIPQLCHALPMQSVEAFSCEIRVSSVSEANRIEAFFAAMPNLRKLTIDSYDHGIMNLLKPQSTTSISRAPSQTVVLPDLKVLQLINIIFRTRPDDTIQESIVPKYIEMLQAREALGHKLEELVIIGCNNVGEGDIDCFEGCVETVDWDGLKNRIDNKYDHKPGFGDLCYDLDDLGAYYPFLH